MIIETTRASELQDGDYFIGLSGDYLFRVWFIADVSDQRRKITFYSPCRPEMQHGLCNADDTFYRVVSKASDAADEICNNRGEARCHHQHNVMHFVYIRSLLNSHGMLDD